LKHHLWNGDLPFLEGNEILRTYVVKRVKSDSIILRIDIYFIDDDGG